VLVVEIDSEQPELIERVAAIDVGKAEVVCCVRVPASDTVQRRSQEVRTFSTMTRSLLELSDWLFELGVTRVVMEATADYWRAPFYVLEERFETWLVNAKHVKHLPGRPKTDLLTELPDQIHRASPRLPLGVARLRAHGRRRVCAAGVVSIGGAAARVA
jgi:transposase